VDCQLVIKMLNNVSKKPAAGMFLIQDLFTNSTDFISLKDLSPDIKLKQFLGTGTDFGVPVLI